ncbi:S-adenosyl-L-methionine-dependent methyltransferase [Westerdykella ornata]|uniref:S-adenosyl-L-methionine-dependent methyltransferase n=1 Tax=Westerdykella ornata TaxID=318751 RepID=A0A6A6JG44_WESOR|nr:S-adenosyl-L-methionine-dependent methyltransferase [Westerdykella ornata]KAF2275382.1 S-adenosyl-L-methionine-dependent methyltransferase [Westerdykella ornata]
MPGYENIRAGLNDAALDLLRLVNGPKNTLRELFFSHYDLAALQVALDKKFFDHVPLPTSLENNAANGSSGSHATGASDTISAADLADEAEMDEDRTARILRLLATHRIFEEVGEGETGIFRHTSLSALLKRDQDFNATGDMQMDDMLRAASETSTVVRKSPYVSDTTHSAFHTRFGMPMYKYYELHPQKGTRFAQAMSSWSQLDRQVSELRESFSWGTLKDGTVVDIGGGSGHISIALAKQFSTLNFIVQDISPHMLSQARETIADDSSLSRRVTFQQHDFFDEQPITSAAAFLLRQVLHNYADAGCIKILRAIVPALERCAPGTPLLINDVVLPESGTVTRYEEHHLRQVDFCMMVALGAKQRSEKEFLNLLKSADDRFEVRRVCRNPLGVGLVEVVLGMHC